MQPQTTKPRPEGGMIKTRLSAIIAKGGGMCIMSVWTLTTWAL